MATCPIRQVPTKPAGPPSFPAYAPGMASEHAPQPARVPETGDDVAELGNAEFADVDEKLTDLMRQASELLDRVSSQSRNTGARAGDHGGFWPAESWPDVANRLTAVVAELAAISGPALPADEPDQHILQAACDALAAISRHAEELSERLS